jgi:hypothetical protein
LDHSEEILGTLLERERGEKGELREGNVSVERNIFFLLHLACVEHNTKRRKKKGWKR